MQTVDQNRVLLNKLHANEQLWRYQRHDAYISKQKQKLVNKKRLQKFYKQTLSRTLLIRFTRHYIKWLWFVYAVTEYTWDVFWVTVMVYSVSQKIPPAVFWKFFPNGWEFLKRLGIFNQFFTPIKWSFLHYTTNFYSNISNNDKVMPY